MTPTRASNNLPCVKRVLLSGAVALLTLIGLTWSLVDFDTSTDSGTDPVTITDYRATYHVERDGTMRASETVTADFPEGRHGIFRFWDVVDTSNSGVRLTPENIHVRLDGGSVPVAMSWEKHDRFRVAKIGDPDSYLAVGSHTYTIDYTVDGVIGPGMRSASDSPGSAGWSGRDTSQFLWRVVADGWQMPILKSTSTITLPVPPTAATCALKTGDPCTVTDAGPNTRVVTTGALPPSSGVAFRADLPIAAPARDTTPWPQPLDRVLGRSLITVLVLLALSLVTFAIGVFLVVRSIERQPLLPVMYGPPTDPANPTMTLSPVQTYYVARESVPSTALTSTLLFMAERGLVALKRNGDEWTVTSLVSPDVWRTVDPVTGSLARSLNIRASGLKFKADGSVDAGRTLSSAKSELQAATTNWARDSGTVVDSRAEKIGRWLVALAFVVAAALFILGWYPFSLAVLPIAAFAIGGAGLWVSGVGTRRTALGRGVWSQAGGFERLLSTPSNRDRLDFSARKDLYTSYIPYAMAFGCAAAWAAKYRAAMGTEPPTPVWLAGAYGSSPGTGWSSANLDNFDASISSSLSAYSASQSSSSGSGGGFGGGFSGGGGGGGGGGSW